jgi:hypothetical protein
MDYILFIFASHKNQKSFVNIIAEDISSLVGNSDVRFYYGPQSAIITFSSKHPIDCIHDYFSMVLGDSGIVYFVTPYEHDKMSYWLDPKIEKHLFDTDNISKKFTNNVDDQIEAQKLIFGEPEENSEQLLDECEEECEISKLKNTKRDLTFDELFDKIADYGYTSLTDNEKELLKKYVK